MCLNRICGRWDRETLTLAATVAVRQQRRRRGQRISDDWLWEWSIRARPYVWWRALWQHLKSKSHYRMQLTSTAFDDDNALTTTASHIARVQCGECFLSLRHNDQMAGRKTRMLIASVCSKWYSTLDATLGHREKSTKPIVPKNFVSWGARFLFSATPLRSQYWTNYKRDTRSENLRVSMLQHYCPPVIGSTGKYFAFTRI